MLSSEEASRLARLGDEGLMKNIRKSNKLTKEDLEKSIEAEAIKGNGEVTFICPIMVREIIILELTEEGYKCERDGDLLRVRWM